VKVSGIKYASGCDDVVLQYLSRIGELFFHLPSQRPNIPGLFGNFFFKILDTVFYL